MLLLAIVVYATAIIVANLTIAAFGPWVSPINSFVLIGLDLALRDWLHVSMNRWQMAALIASTGVMTYLLNPSAGQIAVASAVAFTVAAAVDWTAFSVIKGSWRARSMWSNIAGATVDSLLFPTLAFGVLMPNIVAAQFVAKVAGGTLWTVIIAQLTNGRLGGPKCS